MAATDADRAAVTVMMENVHREWDVSAAHVKIMSLEGKQKVIATANIWK